MFSPVIIDKLTPSAGLLNPVPPDQVSLVFTPTSDGCLLLRIDGMKIWGAVSMGRVQGLFFDEGGTRIFLKGLEMLVRGGGDHLTVSASEGRGTSKLFRIEMAPYTFKLYMGKQLLLQIDRDQLYERLIDVAPKLLELVESLR
jgi:hypothetical protein